MAKFVTPGIRLGKAPVAPMTKAWDSYSNILDNKLASLNLDVTLAKLIRDKYLKPRFKNYRHVEEGMTSKTVVHTSPDKAMVSMAIEIRFDPRSPAKFFIRRTEADPVIKRIVPKPGKALAIPITSAVGRVFGSAGDWKTPEGKPLLPIFKGTGGYDTMASKKGGRGVFGQEIRYIRHVGKKPFIGAVTDGKVTPLFVLAQWADQWKRIDVPEIVKDFRKLVYGDLIKAFQGAGESFSRYGIGKGMGRR